MDEIRLPLCENGMVVRDGTAAFECTGSAHGANGLLVICSDPSHVKSLPLVTLSGGLSLGPVTYGRVGR